MPVRLHEGDCLDILKNMPDHSIHSIVTDPPYGLSFMGKKWDYDVPSVGIWTEALRVLKPGGHLLAFAGTRTYHRMVVAIEDAGFEIRDQIGWLYGTGFPKATKALKPAWEPICLARKPVIGTVAENEQMHGTGALEISGCRISTSEKDQVYITERISGFNATRSIGGNGAYGGGVIMDRAASYDASKGRWPANIIHDGSDEVLDAFAVYGETKSAARKGYINERTAEVYGKYANSPTNPDNTYADTGTAARFFYCAKASKTDRAGSKHPTVKPVSLIRYLCKLVTPPGGIILDPFAGSGTTGQAAIEEGFDAVLIEREAEYCEDIRRRLVLFLDYASA